MTDEHVEDKGTAEVTSLTLLERVKQDEDQAWGILVQLYAPLIYARCRTRWMLTAHESESIGQDVFASVARSIKTFERVRAGSFRNWIRRITDNKCCDLLRRKQVDVPAGGTDAQRALANIPDDIGGSIDPDEEVTERALLMRQAIKAVKNEFSSRDWGLFWDVTVENRNRKDVASDLGVSDNVVYLVLSRIRKRLREVFQDLIDDDLVAAP